MLLRGRVANSEQSHEHGEKLEEDGETGDGPTMAKPTGMVHFAWGIQPRAALPGANDLHLPLSNYGGVPAPSWESAAAFVEVRTSQASVIRKGAQKEAIRRMKMEVMVLGWMWGRR